MKTRFQIQALADLAHRGESANYRAEFTRLEGLDPSDVDAEYIHALGDYFEVSDAERTQASADFTNWAIIEANNPHALPIRLEYLQLAATLTDANPHCDVERKRAAFDRWFDEFQRTRG